MRSEITVPFDGSAGAVARHHVLDHARSLAEDVVDAALLLVTELATNAVLHGRPAVMLGVEVTASRLRLEVADGGAPFGVDPTPPLATAVHGRGLVIVAALARRWGQRVDGPGKVVWCDLLLEAARLRWTSVDRSPADLVPGETGLSRSAATGCEPAGLAPAFGGTVVGVPREAAVARGTAVAGQRSGDAGRRLAHARRDRRPR